jgi:hypothetical protein
MNHLSPSEFVDLVEGTLDAPRAAHAERCEACRQSGAALRRTLELGTEFAEVPEPSPLFWEHLSARVRDAVAQEPSPTGGWWAWRPASVAFAALAVVVIAVGPFMMRTAPVVVAPGLPVAGAGETPAAFDMTLETNTEVWEVLTAAAADLEWDEAREAGMVMQPAAVDRAVHRLTTDELNELGRLLQSELGRSDE